MGGWRSAWLQVDGGLGVPPPPKEGLTGAFFPPPPPLGLGVQRGVPGTCGWGCRQGGLLLPPNKGFGEAGLGWVLLEGGECEQGLSLGQGSGDPPPPPQKKCNPPPPSYPLPVVSLA